MQGFLSTLQSRDNIRLFKANVNPALATDFALQMFVQYKTGRDMLKDHKVLRDTF